MTTLAGSSGDRSPRAGAIVRRGPDPRGARAAVVALHGRDQDPGYLEAHLVDRLDLPDLAWLLPAAPARSWYPGRFMDPRAANEPQLSHALEVVDELLEDLAEQGVTAERVVLLGFSQGACVAAEYLLSRPRRYRAAALLTGGYVGPPGWRPGRSGRLEGTPVLLASSSRDEWVPAGRVRETAAEVEAVGGSTIVAIDDDPEHHINDATVAAVQRLLAAPTPGRPHEEA